MMVGMPPPHLGNHKPLRIRTQGAVVLRPNHQVPVIGQDHVGQQPHVQAFPGLPQYLLERRVICRLVKDPCTPYRAVEDVIDITRTSTSSPPSHEPMVAASVAVVKKNLT